MTEEEFLEILACYKKEAEDLKKENAKLQKKIEYMRCCGNCIYYALECNEVDIESFNGTLCDNWKIKE